MTAPQATPRASDNPHVEGCGWLAPPDPVGVDNPLRQDLPYSFGDATIGGTAISDPDQQVAADRRVGPVSDPQPVVTSLKTVGVLLLLAALPANLAVTAAALVRAALLPPTHRPAADPRTILISGGK